MNVYDVKIEDLRVYENNPRKNDKSVDLVANSIAEFGFKVPLVIDAENTIICGHTRLKAAKKLGLEVVPCIIADDLTPEQIRAFRLADNKTSEFSDWDFNALEAELHALSDSIDMSEYGFDLDTISADSFGDDFTLPDGDKSEFCQMTFTLHEEQAQLIKYALSLIEDYSETFGNTNKNGNALYEIVKQWAEQKN